jgi:glutamate-ammonia-ligase adenylyltransferase
MAVLALGRLGARQLTATSDLDLIVLYDFNHKMRESDGRRKIDATVYYTRLTQRLVAALTVPTRRGRLYEVDLRLRPDGGKGPVASQVDGFFNYQYKEADLWEHMALTRARPIAGDQALCARVSKELTKLLTMRRDPKEVFRQAREMRGTIADVKGSDNPWDLKLAAGGIVDLDFLAQAFILAYAYKYPKLVGLGTEDVFSEAARLKLLGQEDANALILAGQTFNNLQQWQRTILSGAFDPKAVPDTITAQFANLCGLPNAKALLAHLKELQKTTFETVDKISLG